MKQHINKSIERCPWYTFVGRILWILGITLFFYGFFLILLINTLEAFDETLGLWTWVTTAIQNHPIVAIVLLVVGYLVFLLHFCCLLLKRLKEAVFET